MKRENNDGCWCENNPSFVWHQTVKFRHYKLFNSQSWRIKMLLDGKVLHTSNSSHLFCHLYHTINLNVKPFWIRNNKRNLYMFNFNFFFRVFHYWNCYSIIGLSIEYSIKPFPHNDTFWRPWERSLLKTLWEKEKLLVTSNFSFTHSVFYLIKELPAIFIKFNIVVWWLFQFGPV